MPAPDFKIKPIDIQRFILHRTPLILGIGLILFILSAPVLMTRVSPSYRAETHLMLLPLKQPSLQGRDRDAIPGDLRDYMRTLSNRITSYNILAKAIADIPEEQWPAFLHKNDPTTKNVFRLMSRLQAQEISGTYLLTVSIEAGNPDGLDVVLNTLTDTFLKQLQTEQEQKYSRQFAYLQEERERILMNVEAQREQLVGLADSAGQRAFLHKAYDAHLNRLALLQKSYWDVETDRIEKQRDLNTVKTQNANLALLSLKPAADRKVSENFGINQMERWTYENLQQLRSTIDGLTSENRERRYVETRMESMQDYLEEYRGNVQSNMLDILVQERNLELSKELIIAEAAAQAAQEASTHLLQEKTLAEQQASEISGIIFKAQEIVFNIEQLQTRLAALDSRMDDNRLQARAPLPIHIDRKAQPPDVPFASNRKKLILAAFVLSFGFIGAVCFLFDLLDSRIRSRDDIEKLFRGSIPDPVPLIEGVEPADWTHVLRKPALKPAADAFRQLAVRLYPEQKKNGAKVFCISGTETQTGTSTLAFNLAECFAFNGANVLLLDLNLSNQAPSCAELTAGAHDKNGKPHTPDLETATVHDPVRNIDVLTGIHSPNGTWTTDWITTLLADVRDAYDWVLIDTAPILDDDLTQYVVQLSDAALISVFEDKSCYAHLFSIKAMLEKYEVPAITAILQGAHQRPGKWIERTIQAGLAMMTHVHRKYQTVSRKITRPGDRT